MMTSRQLALWCTVPLSIAVLLDSLELFACRAQLAAGGLYGYEVLATGRRVFLHPNLRRAWTALFRYPNVLALIAAQLAGATTLLVAAAHPTPSLVRGAAIACALIAAARMLLYARNQLGLDGSDQMILVVAIGASAALGTRDPLAQRIALFYIAAQLLLSYAVAGIAKAISPEWRSGRAIIGILSTIGYGVPAVGGWLRRHELVARGLCSSVILFECGAPFSLLAGTRGALVVVVGGVAFHCGVAALMGLNIFLWSFAAAYPALFALGGLVDDGWARLLS